MYGSYFTDEILGQIGNRFFGHLECPETAEWASKLFGDQEIEQYTTSQTKSKNGSSTTRNQQIVTRRVLLPAELLMIPPCDLENGLSGYFLTRSQGCFHANLPGDALFKGMLIPPAPGAPEYVPRAIDAQYLAPWTDQQRLIFGATSPEKAQDQKRPRERKAQLNQLDEMDNL
jgi:hypothetical protein